MESLEMEGGATRVQPGEQSGTPRSTISIDSYARRPKVGGGVRYFVVRKLRGATRAVKWGLTTCPSDRLDRLYGAHRPKLDAGVSDIGVGCLWKIGFIPKGRAAFSFRAASLSGSHLPSLAIRHRGGAQDGFAPRSIGPPPLLPFFLTPDMIRHIHPPHSPPFFLTPGNLLRARLYYVGIEILVGRRGQECIYVEICVIFRHVLLPLRCSY